MLKPRLPQESFYGSYLYDRIVPTDHLLSKINQVVDPVSITGQAFLLYMIWSGADIRRILVVLPKTPSSCSVYTVDIEQSIGLLSLTLVQLGSRRVFDNYIHRL